MNYKYYDTPDGEDCFLKMGYLTSRAAVLGVIVGANDAVTRTHAKGYVQTAGRVLYYSVPFSVMAATFVATSCAANSLRGKDDSTNYVIGALSSGSIYGVWQKNIGSGIKAGLLLSAIAYLKKWSLEEGFEIFPTPLPTTRKLFDPSLDYSKLKNN